MVFSSALLIHVDCITITTFELFLALGEGRQESNGWKRVVKIQTCYISYSHVCPGIGSHQFLSFVYEIMLRNTYSALTILA